ncbi:MAG: hypothetical protein ACPGIJ_08965, partial [Mycobacterium sp.]
ATRVALAVAVTPSGGAVQESSASPLPTGTAVGWLCPTRSWRRAAARTTHEIGDWSGVPLGWPPNNHSSADSIAAPSATDTAALGAIGGVASI